MWYKCQEYYILKRRISQFRETLYNFTAQPPRYTLSVYLRQNPCRASSSQPFIPQKIETTRTRAAVWVGVEPWYNKGILILYPHKEL